MQSIVSSYVKISSTTSRYRPQKSVRFCASATSAKSVVMSLKERGLLQSTTHSGAKAEEQNSATEAHALESHLLKGSTSVYAGFDPTADSLHVGNLLTIIGLSHFQRAGHKAIGLVGGATGMIGDPSGKAKERVLLDEAVIQHNVKQIEKTLSACLSHGSFKIVNNMDWYKNMNIITFLRDVGKTFRVNVMMHKDSVKNRLESNEGMSFTEFSYQLLQGYDFLRLFQQEKCTVQIGGSDQWGNITAGCDLIHKTKQADAFGLTLPLLTTSTGQKIGKSEGISGTIWLSEHKTSVYEFYQHFIRTEDADVMRYLKVFTFLPMEEISKIEEGHLKNPGERRAQKVLAEEITKFVHGEEGLKKAKDASSILFGALEDQEALKKLKFSDLSSVAFKDVPKINVGLSKLEEGIDLVSLAALIALVPSKGNIALSALPNTLMSAETKRLISAGGLYLNNNRIENNRKLTREDLIDSKFCLIRSGKKNYKFIIFEYPCVQYVSLEGCDRAIIGTSLMQ